MPVSITKYISGDNMEKSFCKQLNTVGRKTLFSHVSYANCSYFNINVCMNLMLQRTTQSFYF